MPRMRTLLPGPRVMVLAMVLSVAMRSVALSQEHPVEKSTSVATGVAEHGEAKQEPKLLPGPDRGLVTALTTLIVFVFLLIVLSKFAWGPISKGLKEREDKIRRDIAEAEAARQKAEATLRQYNEQLAAAEGRIRDMLAKAQVDGEKLATTIRMQAQTEAEDIKERAQKDIDAAKNAAIGEIYSQAADLSTSIAEKILKRNLNADDQRELVRQSLEQLQTVKA